MLTVIVPSEIGTHRTDLLGLDHPPSVFSTIFTVVIRGKKLEFIIEQKVI
jgi:hypothetical protein